jgi:hypothetical protein
LVGLCACFGCLRCLLHPRLLVPGAERVCPSQPFWRSQVQPGPSDRQKCVCRVMRRLCPESAFVASAGAPSLRNHGVASHGGTSFSMDPTFSSVCAPTCVPMFCRCVVLVVLWCRGVRMAYVSIPMSVRIRSESSGLSVTGPATFPLRWFLLHHSKVSCMQVVPGRCLCCLCRGP